MTEVPEPKLRVFLADDHPLVLDGIRSLLKDDPGLEIVGEARDGRAALRMTIELKPDVIVLDLSMPGMNGVDVTRRLRCECPACKVIILTVHEDRSYFRKLIEVGAVGYVLKRSVSDDLRRAIHSVAEGGIYLDPAIAGKAIDGLVNRPGEAADPGVDLSEREIEVLRLAALGYSNKELATRLTLSVKSVETYKARGMDKLGFHSRVQLVGYAVAEGWLKDV
ncbi:two component transcriptional regulator, LuxR family [Rhodoblastus acidophilus]|uniref:Two component transcriptional regulator, LuxR family n=1 Tax=Rhodoblastus acidophilus TaxID=1074 RepID=A0A212QNX5_RHOAC|nr:response regulator transcription factor [Rhodoblastus acidophilus]MCW2317895.1 DNA-binding NarL/FixJ family response regulator [Rhodoblastus acidophilus]PPQ38972.1 DNA-binding response regulator [Rhodoblastus acidophilus]RAI20092.1 DNA-binding response regulator [Rhodoblastus acidophilus]SNB61125.1 two component transcriptional regulator, LuxR family [Rhodoblastus acidophilus]